MVRSFELIKDKVALILVSISGGTLFLKLCIFISVLPSKHLIKLYKESLEKTFGLVSVQPCECNPVCDSPSYAILMFGHQRAGFTVAQHFSRRCCCCSCCGEGAMPLWSLVIFGPHGAHTSSEVFQAYSYN